MGEHLKRLKELRLNKGISQKEIADYLGVTVASYSLYERGNREPNVATLKKIAEYYGVSLDYLTENTDYFYVGSNPPIDAVVDSVNQTLKHWDDKPQTIAAHFDGDEYTEDELKQIQQFAEFVKSKRKDLIQSPPAKEITLEEANKHFKTDISKYIKEADKKSQTD